MKTAIIVFGLLLSMVLSAYGQIPQSISYQGRLTQAGGLTVPDGSYSVTFRLYAASTGGVSLWSETQNVTTRQGLFTAILGSVTPLTLAFDQTYWLGISISGGAESTPRSALAASPYALMSRKVTAPLTLTANIPYPGYVVKAENTSGGDALFGKGNTGSGVLGESNLGPGVTGNSNTLNGVAARSQQNDAILAVTFAANRRAGVFANSPLHDSAFLAGPAAGVYGFSPDSAGVLGESPSIGVLGKSTSGTGVKGASQEGTGIHGISEAASGTGVYGEANIGLMAQGVLGFSGTGSGVMGLSDSRYGVWGYSNYGAIGVYGLSAQGDGLRGEASADYKSGIFALNTNPLGYAGFFTGRVHVNGTLSKAAGSFKIDHPLDPANKYLQHSFVESPDMMNVYNGNVTTDGSGMAVVALPEYFEALNRDFRYQLTVIGQFAQAIVAEEITNNRFTIRTDKPAVKVSWWVTGIRKDVYAEAHRIQVEVDKGGEERGKYLFPVEHGQPESAGIRYANPTELPEKAVVNR